MRGDDTAAGTPGPPHNPWGLSPNEAKSDSRLRLGIDSAPYPPRLCSVVLGQAQMPARGKHVRGRLREELANDRGAWDVEVFGQTLQHRLRGPIQPQHKR
jgi:hypothetical protein